MFFYQNKNVDISGLHFYVVVNIKIMSSGMWRREFRGLGNKFSEQPALSFSWCLDMCKGNSIVIVVWNWF